MDCIIFEFIYNSHFIHRSTIAIFEVTFHSRDFNRLNIRFAAAIERIAYTQNRVGQQAASALALSEAFRLGLKQRRTEIERLIKRTQVVYSELDSIGSLLKETRTKVDDIRLSLVQELLTHDQFYQTTKRRDGHLDFCAKLMDISAVDCTETFEVLNEKIRTLELENSRLRQQAYLNVSFILFYSSNILFIVFNFPISIVSYTLS